MKNLIWLVDKNLALIPFNKDTPLFLSKAYYKNLEECKKFKDKYVILTFYNSNFYRRQLNAVLIYNGKIISIFGESFSKKTAEFNINEKKICILFYFDAYSNKSNFNVRKTDLFICLDNFELFSDLVYTKRKFKNKIIFISSL